MTKLAKASLVSAMALVVALVGGCGGGDEASEPASLSETKAEFIAKAGTACEKARADLNEEVSSFLEQPRLAGKPSKTVNAELARFVILPTIEEEIWRIERVVPNRIRERVGLILTHERYAVDEVATTLQIPSIAAIYRPFAKSARMFSRYGLAACANGPAPPPGVKF